MKSNKISFLVQNVAIKGSGFLKIILSALLFKPEDVAVYGIFLLALSVMDFLTQIGVQNYCISNKYLIGKNELNVIRTLNTLKAFAVFFIMMAVSTVGYFKDVKYNEVNLYELGISAGLWFLIRNLHSPKEYIFIRAKKYRFFTVKEISYVTIDLIGVMLVGLMVPDHRALIFSLILSEIFRTFYSYIIFKDAIKFQWCGILVGKIIAYGKWIWSINIIILVINQLDKIVLGYLLSPSNYGQYQLATRLAQALMADPFALFGQYLLPYYARKQRIGKLEEALRRILIFCIPIILSYYIFLKLYSGKIINILSDKWEIAIGIIDYALVPASIGGIIALIIPYVYAKGMHAKLPIALTIQFFTLIILYMIYWSKFDPVVGFYLNTASGVIFLLTLIYLVKK